MNMQLRIDIHE